LLSPPSERNPSLVAAMGVIMVVDYLTKRVEDKDVDKPFEDKMINGLAKAIVKPLIYLVYGYVLHLFM
jgi:hypothetical protein